MDKKYNILNLEHKSIPENPARTLKSADEIISSTKERTSKIQLLYENGYSPEFISKIGIEQKWLTKRFTETTIWTVLRKKGYIQSDKEE